MLNHFAHLDFQDLELAALELNRAANRHPRGSDTRDILQQVALACAEQAAEKRKGVLGPLMPPTND